MTTSRNIQTSKIFSQNLSGKNFVRMITAYNKAHIESYRLHEEMFESGLDIVVICRVNAKNASYHEIEHALLGLAKKHGIVVENEKKME